VWQLSFKEGDRLRAEVRHVVVTWVPEVNLVGFLSFDAKFRPADQF